MTARAQIQRTDPERFALIEDVGRFCPCGIDLYRNGCYRCLHARGAVYLYNPNAKCTQCGALIPLSGHACTVQKGTP